VPTRIHRIEIERGRQDEFERTDTGTARIFVHDTEGLYDPTNASSPYFGTLDSAPVALALRNPVTDTSHPRFRGVVDEYGFDVARSQVKEDVVISCVDALDHLANFEMAPGLAGDPPPAGSEDYIFFEDTGDPGMQIRIEQALGNAGWPTSQQSIFTGNVSIQESLYSAGESILTVCQDAVEAEMPTVAQMYCDRFGFIIAHGRLARFTPDAIAATATHWDFHRWKAGDGAAVQADSTRAHIRPPFGFQRSRKMIRNAALAYPMRRPNDGIPDVDRADQVVIDTTSIDQHGTHSWSATDLLTLEGTGDFNSGNDANVETKSFAQYIVDNYAQPQNRINQITFKSMRPSDPRAAANWDLICNVDISDIVNVAISHPGGGGFDEVDFYVEGINEVWTPLYKDLDIGYPAVTLTLDLSPTTYWANAEAFGG
jgi:hypothetical protein